MTHQYNQRPFIYRSREDIDAFLEESQLWRDIYEVFLRVKDNAYYLKVPSVKMFNEVRYQCVRLMLDKHPEENDGIERLPMTAFICYAEEHYPADQNSRAKVLKEALGDVFNIRKIDDEAYEKWKRLGTKESFDERMAESMNRIAERPQMKDNNGIVAGGSVTAKVALTDDQVRMLAQQRF